MKTKSLLPKFRWLVTIMLFLALGIGNAWGAATTGTFTKITSTDALTTGYYIIVASESASTNTKAVGNSVNSNKRIEGVNVTITNGTTISNPDEALVYLITKNNSNYTFLNVKNSTYLYQASTTSGKGMGFQNSSANITCAGYNSTSPIGFKFTLNGNSNNFFKWNNSSSWFANYANDYTTSMAPVRMFKAYKVIYNGNGNTSGAVPTDATYYSGSGSASVTVKTNSGSLAKTGYTFAGWNTKADGSGTNYTAGTGTFTITANTTLYAKWESTSSCTSLSTPSVTAAPNNGSINLSWAAVEHASSYTVTCINKSTGVAAGTVGSVEGTTTKTCNITGLTNGTEYTWSVMPVGTGTYCADNTAASGDITPNVSYTVTWNNNGSEYTTTTVADGSKPVFPATPTSCDDESTTFYGWSTSTWSGKTDDVSGETIYTSADDMPAVTGNGVVYHAVFAKGSAGTVVLNEEFDNETTADASTAISSSKFPNFSGETSKAYTSKYGGIKLGSNGNAGYITSKSLNLSSAFTVSIDACKYGSQATDIQVTVGSTTKTISRDDMNADGTYKTHVLSFGAATSTSTVKIGTSGERAYIDNVVITTAGTATDYMTTCAVCDYKVNIIKGSETDGTFVLSRSGEQATCDGGRVITVTPTPADHYRVASVTASAPSGAGSQGTATVTGPVNGVYTVTYSNEAKGNSTVNVVFEAIPQHTITLVPSAPANGTTSLESAGTTSVTLEEGIICSLWTVPDDCYSLSSITITPADGYSELEANGENKWEIIDITKDLSVAVVYAQRAQYTVTLDAGTGSVAGSTSITQSNCGNITLPAASPSDACAAEGWEFAGWSRTKVNIETTSSPVLIPAGSFAPTATETLYAVYKQSSGEAVSTDWLLVKDDKKLGKGDSIVITSYYSATGMSNVQGSNSYRGTVSVTLSDSPYDTLKTPLPATLAKFILQEGTTSGTWAFYDPDNNGYLYASSSSGNELKTQSTNDANGSWTIDVSSTDGEATVTAQGSNTHNLLCHNSGNPRFACYTNTSNQVHLLCLYSKSSGVAYTYYSSPSCLPCVDSEASIASAVSMGVGTTHEMTLSSLNTATVTAVSSNTEVVTVSVTGKTITLTSIAEGEATITVEQARDAEDESGHCAVYKEIAVSVTTPTIEIIEWEREAVTIEYDGADDANVVLGHEVEHGSKTGNVATELFFSKYFEAAGTDKLFGIYNGTTDTIVLTDYFVRTQGYGTTHSLASYGETPGKIAPKEEIIIYTFGSTAYSKTCMDTVAGSDKWNQVSWEGLAFSGRHSIGLYRKDKSGNDSIIDIIGATYYDPSNPTDYAPALVILDKVEDGGVQPSWGDESGFVAESCGDNIRTKDIETNYGLSTNRCLLVRKNTVRNGANALAKDTLNVDSVASSHEVLAAASFKTLCEEWGGYHVVGKGSAGKDNTCEGMSEVAKFDYSSYYVTMETFNDTTTIGQYNNGDGTYTIPMPHLDTLACKLIRIQLKKGETVVASSDPQVPILVDRNMSTTDLEFYQHTIDTCKTCDVVVRDGAKLTKATNGAANDRPEVKTVTVYSGSQLIIPSGATNMVVENLVLRSLDDTVSTASFVGGIRFKGSGYKSYHSKRVQHGRWYWFCLPHACSTSKITWQDGTKATIGKDWHLKYYDGAQRAATQAGGCWKEYTGSTIQPGVGYILSVEERVGHTYRELIFPMDTISEGSTTKGVPVDDYGAGEDIRPNHKGWNLVGNPYMTYYEQNKINAGNKNLPALTVGKLIKYDSIDTENPLHKLWIYRLDAEGGNNAPFVTIPKDHGESEYEQHLIMDFDLPPFISYFVQIGNNTPVSEQQYVNFAKADLTNDPSSLIPRSYVRKRVQEEPDASLETVLVTLHLENGKKESDETTLLISDLYTKDYEIGSDLGKMFGEKFRERSKPICYSKDKAGSQMAFQSLPDSSAAEWIPLGYWGYNTDPITVSVRRQNRKLDYVESVILHDKTMGTYTELLENDYTFSPTKQSLNGSRLEIKAIVKRPSPSVATGMDEAHAGMYAYANGSRQLVVVGLPEHATIWIYDALGHLIACEQTSHYMRTYTLPCAGVYFVRVNNEEGQRTLRTIVK